MLLKTARTFDLEVEAACVLTTHYHAVLDGAVASLSAGLQWFHSRYARAFNRRYDRVGHVFAERFQCRTVDEDGVFDRCLYVLANPVNAGLCDLIDRWPWSYSRYGMHTVA